MGPWIENTPPTYPDLAILLDNATLGQTQHARPGKRDTRGDRVQGPPWITFGPQTLFKSDQSEHGCEKFADISGDFPTESSFFTTGPRISIGIASETPV